MSSFIRDVWAENVDAEFVTIREAIVNYPYVAMVRCSLPTPRTQPLRSDICAIHASPSGARSP